MLFWRERERERERERQKCRQTESDKKYMSISKVWAQ